jgi:hypothetical protein
MGPFPLVTLFVVLQYYKICSKGGGGEGGGGGFTGILIQQCLEAKCAPAASLPVLSWNRRTLNINEV